MSKGAALPAVTSSHRSRTPDSRRVKRLHERGSWHEYTLFHALSFAASYEVRIMIFHRFVIYGGSTCGEIQRVSLSALLDERLEVRTLV